MTGPAPRIRRRAGRGLSRKTSMYVVLVGLALVMAYPLLWMLGSSFKPDNEIFTESGVIPKSFTWDHWIQGWQGVGIPFGRFFLNSFIVSGLTALGSVIACSLAAFAFARLEFRLKKVWFACMLATIMLSSQVTIVPRYILFNKLGWVNTYLPLIVPAFLATDSFFIFLMVQFMRAIPRELDEAARLDGCGPMRIYWYVMLPLVRPALATTAVFAFIWSYGDFFNQLIYISDPNKFTVALGLRMFLDSSGQQQWGNMLAMSTASLLPVFILFLLFQRHLIAGFATTGLK